MSNLHELASVALPSTTIKTIRTTENGQIIMFRLDGLIIIIGESMSNYRKAKNIAYSYYRQGYKVRVIVEGVEAVRLMNWSKKEELNNK